jgi:hypothetical protein
VAPVLWPREALRFFNFRVDPAPRNLHGPVSADGVSQVASSDAGIWTGALDQVAVHQRRGAQGVEAWHAISGLLEGRLTPLVVPVRVAGRRPLPAGVADGDIDCEPGVPHSDDSLFDDDAGYETQWIDVRLGANANRRATQITLDKIVCGDIRPGMRFSILSGEIGLKPIRLYQVKRVVSQAADAAIVTIWPPLREALTEGQMFEFARPYVQMRLASDREMDLMLTRPAGIQFATVNLIEDL